MQICYFWGIFIALHKKDMFMLNSPLITPFYVYSKTCLSLFPITTCRTMPLVIATSSIALFTVCPPISSYSERHVCSPPLNPLKNLEFPYLLML